MFKDTGLFDRVACVTLQRRPDRWQSFLDLLPEDWPFGAVEKYSAIDGKLCQRPDWWKQGGGAWGCYRSHVNILEECLNHGIYSCLFLEDDAVCCEDFGAKYRAFFEALPNKENCFIYLGGQHLGVKRKPPFALNSQVYVPYNVNRTHAFALVGRKMMTQVYKHLNATKGWRNKQHIDHHLGRLHQQRTRNVYSPPEWLIGQDEGQSNIAGRKFKRRYWPAASKVRMLPCPFNFVLGTHRSGSSMTAMVLHKLGVHMGNTLIGYEQRHGGGGEAQGLAQLCEKHMPFPSTKTLNEFALRRDMLTWMRARCREAIANGKVPGGKYPHLAAWGPLLEQITHQSMRVIHIDRPLEESVASMRKRMPNKPKKAKAVQEHLHQKLQGYLADKDDKVPVLHLQYHEVLTRPEYEVDRIVEFLGIKPNPEQRLAAIQHVNPDFCHNKATPETEEVVGPPPVPAFMQEDAGAGLELLPVNSSP